MPKLENPLPNSRNKVLREPVAILKWLRDHAHHSGSATEQGLALSGVGGRVTLSRDTSQHMEGLYETDPLIGTRAPHLERMYAPTAAGHKLLAAAELGVTFEQRPDTGSWRAVSPWWTSRWYRKLTALANSKGLPITQAEMDERRERADAEHAAAENFVAANAAYCASLGTTLPRRSVVPAVKRANDDLNDPT